ncbi:JAM1 protein, partial [Dasyornis broadbenti]|nr:JAM1 protein [Dasyornis broadbenti]
AVDIPCSAFRSQPNPRIEWKFQKGSSLVLFYYGGELTEPYRERVQFSPTSIRFRSVTREDSGKYICEVVGDGGTIAKSEVTLTVQGEATPALGPWPCRWPCPLSLALSPSLALSLALSPALALSLVPVPGPWPCPRPCPWPCPQ